MFPELSAFCFPLKSFFFLSAIWECCRAYLPVSKAPGWTTLNLGEGIIAVVKYNIFLTPLGCPQPTPYGWEWRALQENEHLGLVQR